MYKAGNFPHGSICTCTCTYMYVVHSTFRQPFVYKYKNHEVGCRDDTVPKTVDTRRHCEEE